MAGRNKVMHWLPADAFSLAFGIHHRSLSNRGVLQRDEGGMEFELISAVDLAGDLLWKKHGRVDVESLIGQEELKSEKLRQEIRKLELDNDEREGRLVDASGVEIVYSRAMKEVSDMLDSTVSQIRMQLPDLPQAALVIVSEIMTKVRRRASRLELTGVDEFDDDTDAAID